MVTGDLGWKYMKHSKSYDLHTNYVTVVNI